MVLFVELPFGLKIGKYTSPYASVWLPVSVCASCCAGSFQLRHALCSCGSSFIVLVLRPSESIRTAKVGRLIRFCHRTGSSLLARRNMIFHLNVRIISHHLHSMCLTRSRLEYIKNNGVVLVAVFRYGFFKLLNTSSVLFRSHTIKPNPFSHESRSSRRTQRTWYHPSPGSLQLCSESASGATD